MLAEAALHALGAELSQVFLMAHAVRRGEFGQMAAAELYLDIAFFGDLGGIGKRLLVAAELPAHLLLGLQIELLGLHAHALGLVNEMPRLYA